ncbi:transcription termination factor MTEF18, mitochondrial-like [Argentina anserina]|uniref:transcription termination factor MTEF18, mitochondrial-like n=1 Tax=Argentina anserina TaxID=57926 RepID=UPI0021765064|nr:transcription termination factor MTEF18, mitochondrial-like [Potentilla anserina]
MIHLHKLRNSSILKWVSSDIAHKHLRYSRTPLQPFGSFPSSHTIWLYSTKTSFEVENTEKLETTSISRAMLKEAQAALLEYLHYTRGLQFLDAENMSKNSPQFLDKLLRSVDGKIDKEIGGLISRYLRYHPINEFEPFLESLGLKPSEYIPQLPRNLMFLADDVLLLHNYSVLCTYGVARNKMGKIYKEAKEVFQYDLEVLLSKLQAYEEVGLSQFNLVKFIVCSPCILVGDVNLPFVRVLVKLKSLGLETHWIEMNLSEDNSYNWSQMLEVLRLFDEVGCSNEELVELLGQHPDILFESSGRTTLSLIGFLLKFGSTRSQICSMFLQFPQIRIVQFVLNLRKCVLVLNEIEMEVAEIEKIVCSHSVLLGSCALKSTNSLLSCLNIGKKRLCRYIQENPEVLKKWVLGRRVEPLPDSEEDSKEKRIKFLFDVGFVEKSNKMNVALKLFRGKGRELQDRFDCIVNAGLSRQDVCEMIKVSPQILNQQRTVLQMKIDVLVNHLGYPVSTLVNFPSYLSYTTQRVKLRVFMYNWLSDQGTISPTLALSTVVAMVEKQFISQYVIHHPCGPQVWHELKSKLYS